MRFTAAQNEELREKGSFVWLNYRAGPEPDRPLRRPYVVTQEALDAHATRRMDHLDQLPSTSMVLNLHGKGDGTGMSFLTATDEAHATQYHTIKRYKWI